MAMAAGPLLCHQSSAPPAPARPAGLSQLLPLYSEAFSDVTLTFLCADGENLFMPAHKLVLCRAAYFAAMFAPGMKEGAISSNSNSNSNSRGEREPAEVRISVPTGISAKVLQKCISVLYGESPSEMLLKNRESVLQFLRAADFFMLSEVLEQCAKVLESSATLEECACVLEVCDAHVSLNFGSEPVSFGDLPYQPHEIVRLDDTKSDAFWAQLWRWAWATARDFSRERRSAERAPPALYAIPRAEMLMALLLQTPLADGPHAEKDSLIFDAARVPAEDLEPALQEILSWCDYWSIADGLSSLLKLLDEAGARTEPRKVITEFQVPHERVQNLEEINLGRAPISRVSEDVPMYGLWQVEASIGFWFGCCVSLLARPAVAKQRSELTTLTKLCLTTVSSIVEVVGADGEAVCQLATEDRPTTQLVKMTLISMWKSLWKQAESAAVDLHDERLLVDGHVQIRIVSEARPPLLFLAVQHHLTRNLLTLTDRQLETLPQSFLLEALQRAEDEAISQSFGVELFELVLRWACARGLPLAPQPGGGGSSLSGSGEASHVAELLSYVHVKQDGYACLKAFVALAFGPHRKMLEQYARASNTAAQKGEVSCCNSLMDAGVQASVAQASVAVQAVARFAEVSTQPELEESDCQSTAASPARSSCISSITTLAETSSQAMLQASDVPVVLAERSSQTRLLICTLLAAFCGFFQLPRCSLLGGLLALLVSHWVAPPAG